MRTTWLCRRNNTRRSDRRAVRALLVGARWQGHQVPAVHRHGAGPGRGGQLAGERPANGRDVPDAAHRSCTRAAMGWAASESSPRPPPYRPGSRADAPRLAPRSAGYNRRHRRRTEAPDVPQALVLGGVRAVRGGVRGVRDRQLPEGVPDRHPRFGHGPGSGPRRGGRARRPLRLGPGGAAPRRLVRRRPRRPELRRARGRRQGGVLADARRGPLLALHLAGAALRRVRDQRDLDSLHARRRLPSGSWRPSPRRPRGPPSSRPPRG